MRQRFVRLAPLFLVLMAVFLMVQSSVRDEHQARQVADAQPGRFEKRQSLDLMSPHLYDLKSGTRIDPVKVDLCQLNVHPDAFNHKVVEVTGFISHGFEDFTLSKPQCPSGTGIWLEYGGKVASGTIYCCGVTAKRSRPKPLVVEKMAIPLVDDKLFREFDNLLHRRRDSVVHASVVGRFFAGKKIANGTQWEGYGHMGCCSLLAIQQVVSVDPQDRTDLDYDSSVDSPDVEKAGCGFKILDSPGDWIELQRKVDLGERNWALYDPQRVARDGLAHLLNIDEKSIAALTVTRKAQGRFVYEWSAGLKGKRYMIVVSRPYLLAFYAKDPKRIAWTVIAAYEYFCE